MSEKTENYYLSIKKNIMPTVWKKTFAYTNKWINTAKSVAKKTGKPVVMTKTKKTVSKKAC